MTLLGRRELQNFRRMRVSDLKAANGLSAYGLSVLQSVEYALEAFGELNGGGLPYDAAVEYHLSGKSFRSLAEKYGLPHYTYLSFMFDYYEIPKASCSEMLKRGWKKQENRLKRIAAMRIAGKKLSQDSDHGLKISQGLQRKWNEDVDWSRKRSAEIRRENHEKWQRPEFRKRVLEALKRNSEDANVKQTAIKCRKIKWRQIHFGTLRRRYAKDVFDSYDLISSSPEAYGQFVARISKESGIRQDYVREFVDSYLNPPEYRAA